MLPFNISFQLVFKYTVKFTLVATEHKFISKVFSKQALTFLGRGPVFIFILIIINFNTAVRYEYIEDLSIFQNLCGVGHALKFL